MKALLLSILILTFAYSQRHCGTSELPDSVIEKFPWYGNNQFLYDYADNFKNIKL